MRIGISLYGLRIPDMYKSSDDFLQNLDKIAQISNIFEIPVLPLSWIPQIAEYKRENNIKFYSMHMPKNFFGLSLPKRMMLLKQTQIIVNKLDISVIVFHPFVRELDKQIINSVDILVRNKEYISFELCNECLLKNANSFLANTNHKLLIDFAHLTHMNIPLKSMNMDIVSHIHLRGYKKDTHYTRISESLNIIETFIIDLNNSGFKGNIILEYPYESINDIQSDYKLISNII